MGFEAIVDRYMEAIRDGDSEPLEQLALSAGYTRPYEGWRVLEDARAEVESALKSMSIPIIFSAFDSYCDTVIAPFMSAMSGEEYGDGREQFGIPSDEELSVMSKEEKTEYIDRYLHGTGSLTSPLWANKESGFILTKEGPYPHNNSMVAYVTWLSQSKDGSVIIEPENRRFFIEVYDEDPLWEFKLDWGVYTSIHNERADKAEAGKRVEPYVYGEADGSGPHVVDFEVFEKISKAIDDSGEEGESTRKLISKLSNFPRNYSDGLRIAWRTENLIYGEEAIRYLFDLRDNRENVSFPLSREGYQRLIGYERSRVEELEAKIGDYTLDQILDIGHTIQSRFQSAKTDLEAIQEEAENSVSEEKEFFEQLEERRRGIMENIGEMNEQIETIKSYRKLQDERNHLERLEEAASRL
jgi:hypothetical protein